MAGDWIEFEHSTLDKPEVFGIAAHLDITPEQVIGCLLKVWVWADRQSLNGHGVSVTDSALNRLAGEPRFAEAMRKVGWLVGDDGCATFPNFGRHNGQTAKTRALARKRKQKQRINLVTDASRTDRDKIVSTEQNRTEQKNTEEPPLTPPSPPTPKKPTRAQAALNAVLPESIRTPAVEQAWRAWVQGRIEKRQTPTPTAVERTLANLAGFSPTVAAAALNRSADNGWTGVFPENEQRGNDGKSNLQRSARHRGLQEKFGHAPLRD